MKLKGMNIYFGPMFPVFLSPNVAKVLVETCLIRLRKFSASSRTMELKPPVAVMIQNVHGKMADASLNMGSI